MSVIELDIPLLFIGLFTLVWIRARRSFGEFQVACQFFGTFWAQYSLVVSWSLGKLIPYFSASSIVYKRIPFGVAFSPFIFYTIVYSIVSSLFWKIPAGVEFAYGEGRVWIQLASFVVLVLSARGLAAAMSDERAIALMWKAVVVLGLVHGFAFIYQYIATLAGLPFIGISRAHGLNFESGAGDVAAFAIEGGVDILRPGGLAGEPKTVAVVFGLVFMSLFFAGSPPGTTRRWTFASKLSIAFSVVGLLGAFSTSGYFGFFSAYLILIFLKVIRSGDAIRTALLAFLILIVGELCLSLLNLPGLLDLLAMRTVDRVGSDSEMDPPVEAAIAVMKKDFSIFLFGTGIGGGSFQIMQHMGKVFEYSLSPNIGIVALVFELGFFGFSLFVVPFFILAYFVSRNKKFGRSWPTKFLLSLGVSAMAFMITGSGIAMGYPLAVGCLLGAYGLLVKKSS